MPRRHRLPAVFKPLGISFADYDRDKCPQCQRHWNRRCKCHIGDKQCAGGHLWVACTQCEHVSLCTYDMWWRTTRYLGGHFQCQNRDCSRCTKPLDFFEGAKRDPAEMFDAKPAAPKKTKRKEHDAKYSVPLRRSSRLLGEYQKPCHDYSL